MNYFSHGSGKIKHLTKKLKGRRVSLGSWLESVVHHGREDMEAGL